MEKGTDVHLVAASAIALDSLILLWMVQALNCGVTLATFDSTRAVLPTEAILEGLAVLGRVFEQVGWPSEVSRVVRVDARFRIVAVLFIWAPASLVEEHEEDVALLLGLDVVQPTIQIAELQQALRHEVVLDALVLEVSVHCFYQLEVGKREADQLIG